MSELLSPTNLQPTSHEYQTPLEIVRSGERIRRVETIPLDNIQIEFSLVDESHSQDLADSMKKDWGQISEITVRARELGDESVGYDIIDGFHRTNAKKANGDSDINAIVLYGVSDEELYDLRILAVNSVKSVQFARLAEWMNRAFQKSKWGDRGISLTQAFSMAVFDSQKTRHAGIEDVEVEELKDWVRQKATAWQRPVSAVWSNLRLIDISDPNLVKSVRTGGGGKDRVRHLSQGMLKSIAERFPGEGLFHVQRAFAEYSIQHRLGAGETSDFVYRFSQLVDTKKNETEIVEQLSQLVEEDKKSLAATPVDPGEREITLLEGEESWVGDDPEELTVLQADMDGISDNGADQLDHIEEAEEVESGKINGWGADKVLGMRKGVPRNRGEEEFKPYIDKIEFLEEQLRNATTNGNGVAEFWTSAPYLTSREKAIMDALFGDIMRFDDVTAKFRVTPLYLIQTIQSVFIKKKNYAAGESYHLEETSLAAFRNNGHASEIDVEVI